METLERTAARRPARDRAGWARPAFVRGGGVGVGVWVAVAAVTTVLLGWTGSAFGSGRGAVLDALTPVALGWVVIALVAGVLLLAGRLLRGIPARRQRRAGRGRREHNDRHHRNVKLP